LVVLSRPLCHAIAVSPTHRSPPEAKKAALALIIGAACAGVLARKLALKAIVAARAIGRGEGAHAAAAVTAAQ